MGSLAFLLDFETQAPGAMVGDYGALVFESPQETGAAVSEKSGTETLGEFLTRPGMGNLRNMRVEDVAVPRVEIAGVPITVPSN